MSNELVVREDNSLTVNYGNQVEIAKKYPRDVNIFLEESKAMVLADKELAMQCNYCLPRGGKKITGPSVRVAELAYSLYGNCRAASRLVEVTEDNVIAEGIFIDTQRNTMVLYQTSRPIRDSNGVRYNNSMIETTILAALSIAFRNVIFKGIPKVYINAIANTALKSLTNNMSDKKTFSERITDMVEAFSAIGVTKEMIEKKVDKKIEKITMAEFKELSGYYGAIKNNMSTKETIFNTEENKSNINDNVVDAVFEDTELFSGNQE